MHFDGFVRRIDNLGRIVIPKEIRNSLKLKNMDCLEISVENNKIVLTKKNLLERYLNSLENVIKIIVKTFGLNVILTDNDKILYCDGKLTENLLGKELEEDLYRLVNERKNFFRDNDKLFELDGISYILSPIIVNGDIEGSVIVFRKEEKLKESDKFSVEIIRELMIKNLEV